MTGFTRGMDRTEENFEERVNEEMMESRIKEEEEKAKISKDDEEEEEWEVS